MLDRTGEVPVTTYILSTYRNGIPLYDRTPALQLHIISSLRVIFDRVQSGKALKQHLVMIAEAFTSCQAEQGRVIDHVYGELVGRDKGLREQVLILVDIHKQAVMDQVVNQLHPDAWKTSDANPHGQVPHLQNSYRASLGESLGLRGVEAARADYLRQNFNSSQITEAEELFRSLFSVQEIVDSFVKDINQQDQNSERIIDRDTLTKWAAEASSTDAQFDPHSIYYNEAAPGEYCMEAPVEENIYQPFLSQKAALNIFRKLFLEN